MKSAEIILRSVVLLLSVTIHCGCDSGEPTSGHLDTPWIQTDALNDAPVWSLVTNGSSLYAGTSDGILVLSADGITWNPVNTGLANTYVTSLASMGGNLFAGTYGGGVYFSTNNGTNWFAINKGLVSWEIRSLVVIDNDLFAGTANGIFLLYNETWVNRGLTHNPPFMLHACGTHLFADGTPNGFLSTNMGTNWSPVPTLTYANEIVSIGPHSFAATFSGIFFTVDGGTTWTPAGLSGLIVYSLTSGGTNLYAGTYAHGVFLSTNNGSTWTPVGLGDASIHRLVVMGGSIFAVTTDGVVWRHRL